MDEATHKKLLEIDRPAQFFGNGVYSGEDCDYEDSVKRAEMVKQELEMTLGKKLGFLSDQQDAFFWGEIYDLYLSESPSSYCLLVRFSWCGNLAATWTLDGRNALSQDLKQCIAKTLAKYGFLWVDGDVLRRTTYDGAFEYFKKDHYNAPASWWDRFFEYD